MTPEKPNLGVRLQSVSRTTLYILLIAIVSGMVLISKFASIKVPNTPGASEIDAFVALMQVPEGSTVLIQSDYTKGTRGESQGQLEAILRILMRRNIKFAIYSMVDPQAPQVARDVIIRMNAERVAANQRPYEKWTDYVELGFFPNGEATANVLATNMRQAFSRRTDLNTEGRMVDVWQSPVMQNLKSLSDVPLYINVAASNIVNVLIERLSGKVPLLFNVTGVMGPETRIYYNSGQLKGLVVGLKGVYDMETLMENGLNDPANPLTAKSDKHAGTALPGFKGMKNLDRASAYYPTLHAALTLLILAVVVGNVGVALARRANGGTK